MVSIEGEQKAALDRLIAIAGTDAGQSRKVAAFLLSWWNAEECGGFDLTDLWAVDAEIKADIVQVISFILQNHGIYPDAIGYKSHFQAMISEWRPRLDPVQRAILEIRNGKDASLIEVLSTSEQCAVALATKCYDRLPKPYDTDSLAWDRLDRRQRSIVAKYNERFANDDWLQRPVHY